MVLSSVREGAKSTCSRTLGWALGRDWTAQGLMDSGHIWTLGKENIALYKHAGTELSQPMAALVCDQSLQTCKSSRVPSPQLAPCPLSPCPAPGDIFVLWLYPKAEIHPGPRLCTPGSTTRPRALRRIFGTR